MDDIFQGVGIEVTLPSEEAFLLIMETLSRIGVANKHTKTLYQSVHILHKQGRYAIVHFKELFLLDGKEANLSENDLARRNTIASLLEEWELYKILDADKVKTPRCELNQIKIVKHSEKKDWHLVPKYCFSNGNWKQK